MNRVLSALILTASISATAGVSSAVASNREIAYVPFAFHVESATMPAGQYEVRAFQNTPNSWVFSLTDTQGHTHYVAAPLQRKGNPDEPKLTFACERGDCTLTQIDPPGSSVAYGLTQHKPSYTLGLAPQVQIRITH